MDHILHVQVEQQSSPKLYNRGATRFMASADASQLTLALAIIAFLALFLSPGSPSSTLSALLIAATGGIFTSKTALFMLSNVIFLLLAADCRCCFATTTNAASDVVASCGEPGGVLEKQAQHPQVHVEQCAVGSCVPLPCPCSLDHKEQEGEDKSTTMSANTLPDEEQQPKLELVRLGEEEEEEEDGSITLELEVKETTVDVEEPTCEAAQGLDRLEISELNKKFDEFIRSRRIKWLNEEEACSCTRSELLQIDV